jgi:hypothetical protein
MTTSQSDPPPLSLSFSSDACSGGSGERPRRGFLGVADGDGKNAGAAGSRS